jgi:hypothetical protein
LSAQPPDGFRTVSKVPAPGALARARALVRRLGLRSGTLPIDKWQSLAAIWNTGWLPAGASDSPALADITSRRLRALASRPLSFDAFVARRAGEGPLHLQGYCSAVSRQYPATLWRIDERDDASEGRVLIEEGHDFWLAVGPEPVEECPKVYVLSKGGRLASAAPLRAGDEVSVFGFADEVPDRWGLAGGVHGRGGMLPAIRSGSELPLLVTHSRG